MYTLNDLSWTSDQEIVDRLNRLDEKVHVANVISNENRVFVGGECSRDEFSLDDCCGVKNSRNELDLDFLPVEIAIADEDSNAEITLKIESVTYRVVDSVRDGNDEFRERKHHYQQAVLGR